jgi:Ser/Thr protein kinase RdoA (MazF antagonist)
MMRLYHLFHDTVLAGQILDRWEHDADPSDEFDGFRISSNAVYRFRKAGQACYLRFAPLEEKDPEAVQAELDFLVYLRQRGFNAAPLLPALDGRLLVQVQTGKGTYLACAFGRVPGEQVVRTGIDAGMMRTCGAALGDLHRLAVEYLPGQARRPDHLQLLERAEQILLAAGGEEEALEEARFLREGFNRLPRNGRNYGLVHYDFELDNIFIDAASGICSVIDFDDSLYHWFAMDLVQALASIHDEGGRQEFAGRMTAFMEGYAVTASGVEFSLPALRLCQRFANLHAYADLRRALADPPAEQPEWMLRLRAHLEGVCDEQREYFGKPVEYLGSDREWLNTL